jgi:hypothetical protein
MKLMPEDAKDKPICHNIFMDVKHKNIIQKKPSQKCGI